MHIIEKMKETKCSAISDMTLEPHSVVVVIRDGKGYDQQYVKWAKVMDNRSEVRRAMLSNGEYHPQRNIHIWDIAPEILIRIKNEWLDYLSHPTTRAAPSPKPHAPIHDNTAPSFASSLVLDEGESQENLINQMMNDLHLVRRRTDSGLGGEVVFDWACCDGCGNGIFLEDTFQFTIRFIRQALDCGLACIFSDFSVKALITQWNSDIMGGDCPFELRTVAPKTIDGILELEFDCDTLKKCPFQQLKRLGELSYLRGDANTEVVGMAEVHAMDSTVIFNLKPHLRLNQNIVIKEDWAFAVEVLSHSKKTVFLPSQATGVVSWNPHFVPTDITSVCHAIITYNATSYSPPSTGIRDARCGQMFLSQIHLSETQRLGEQARRPPTFESNERLSQILTQTLGSEHAESFTNSYKNAETRQEIEDLVQQAEFDIIQGSLSIRSPTL